MPFAGMRSERGVGGAPEPSVTDESLQQKTNCLITRSQLIPLSMRAAIGLDPTHNVVNRLALVLQVLLDIRSVELQRENEALKDHWRIREELIPDDDDDGAFWLFEQKEETSTASWFDRLALVSNAFMDTRFLELRTG